MGRGKPGGLLSPLHPVELLAQVLSGLVGRNGIDPGQVDDVLIGCVGQVGEQSGTPGRHAWLSAGFPVSVPSTTIERRCGSGQQAIDFAVQGVQAGAYDMVIAGGLESMSRIPMGTNRKDSDPAGPGVHARFPELVSQGIAAELIAEKFSLSRSALDALSVDSHARADAAARAGLLNSQIIPIIRPDGVTVSTDETIRPNTSLEVLAQLEPAFATDEARTRFPSLDWKITAGNSSSFADAAGAALIMSEERAAQLGLQPRARFVASAVAGDDPFLMLTGIIPATHRVLERAKLAIKEIDYVEVNEAFASVPLAWQSEFGFDHQRLNAHGGAIALGHPLGASGIRLFASLLSSLESTHGRYGLQTMCEAGGMANAMVIERL
ncbi:thiolase family protein [Arthrobacter sp. FW306-2-2C-D06B]|uniref:thiolase family protein n=1 Tax=Arthrobacter sp. FW306-2-2C-D06B TaxID=2879618 RepID=UPI003FA408B3